MLCGWWVVDGGAADKLTFFLGMHSENKEN